MKSLTSISLASLLLALSSMAYAVSKNTSIDVRVTHVEFLRFLGDAQGSHFLLADQIRPATNGGSNPTVLLGGLGIESSTVGNCTLDFSSLYGFSLKHSQGNQRFTDYQLLYPPSASPIASNTSITLDCNTPPADLHFQAVGKIKKKVKAGVYSDTLTLTVTSP